MTDVENQSKKPKSKEQYSRNVKKLKYKLVNLRHEIATYEKKIQNLSNTSSDKLISMKIAKFCKQRKMTPEMLFRFADRKCSGTVSKKQFVDTLQNVGLKLSKEEFLRLEYLIDEDLSGQIQYKEFDAYLNAYGIKKQFSPNDLLVQDAFKKIDLSKILQLSDEDNKNNKRKKHQNLLNYEEFIKYCNKHFPQLKNKQLASIFNRLERNGHINLQDLINYLKDQQEEKDRLKKKNDRLLKKDSKDQTSLLEQVKNLKGIIKILFKYRNKDSNNQFYSRQFIRLAKVLDRDKNSVLNLFTQIDKKRRGSFGFNELTSFYIEKEHAQKQVDFAFQIMGKKIQTEQHQPAQIISQYNEGRNTLKSAQLTKMLNSQFQLQDREISYIQKFIQKDENNEYKVYSLVALLNAKTSNKSKVYIKPKLSQLKIQKSDFINNQTQLMTYNGMIALRICINILQKMQEMKQSQWNDYEFGSIEGDDNGLESIELPMPVEMVDWSRTSDLGMTEFYNLRFMDDNKMELTPLCPHEMIVKSLTNLVERDQLALYHYKKMDLSIKKIQQNNLKPLFEGIYPLLFHQFARYGIYVFKFFYKQKWTYVITDDKIPCNDLKAPYFSSTKNNRCAWISLIEKAYAKLHGSYKKLYDFQDSVRYMNQLSSLLPIQYPIQPDIKKDDNKNKLWALLNNTKYEDKYRQRKPTDPPFKPSEIYCLNKKSTKIALQHKNVNTGYQRNKIIQIISLLQLKDQRCQNKHKSHRLLFLKSGGQIKNQQNWNHSWNWITDHNKFKSYQQQILKYLKDNVNMQRIQKQQFLITNFKSFRQIFDTMLQIRPVDFQEMIILRKQIEFQGKFKCRYEIYSENDFHFVIVLNRINSPIQARIKIDIKNDKEELQKQSTFKSGFIVHEITVPKKVHLKIQIYIQNYQQKQHLFNLTFYMKNPRFSLKQRDRHLLFRYVSPYEEEPLLNFSNFKDNEKQYVYKNFYKAAESRGCCG